MNLSPWMRASLGGIVWLAVGLMLVVRGFSPHWLASYDSSPSGAWAILGIAVLIGGAKGWFVLRRSSGRMVGRIEKRPEPAPFWQMYPPLFFLLVPVMIGMGIGIRALFAESYPGVVAAVYIGIGAALVTSSLPFFKAAQRLRASPAT